MHPRQGRAAHGRRAEEIRDAAEFGITVGEPTVDYAAVSARRDKVISTLTGGVAGLMKKNKIEVIEGDRPACAGPGRVTVGGDEITRQDDRAGHRLGQAADPRRRSSAAA